VRVVAERAFGENMGVDGGVGTKSLDRVASRRFVGVPAIYTDTYTNAHLHTLVMKPGICERGVQCVVFTIQ